MQEPKVNFEISKLEEELEKARETLISTRQLPFWVFSDSRVFELEKIRLWPRVWHFLAHESEVLNEGDYVKRYIGPNTQVIVIRDDDSKVRAFLNYCRHRGNLVATADCGNSKFFQCSYHGWTYDSKGKLVGVPFEEIMYGKIDREKLGLIEIRVENYNGLIFGNLDGKAESLDNYLGEFKFYADIFTKRNKFQYYPPHRWIIKANWKGEADNFSHDHYHHYTAHRSMIELGGRPPNPEAQALGISLASKKGHTFVSSGKWHRESGLFPQNYFPAFYPIWAPQVVEEAKKNLTKEQFEIWLNHLAGPLLIFPNWAIDQSWVGYAGGGGQKLGVPFIFIRLYRPLGPKLTEMWSWFAVEKDAPEEFKKLSYMWYIAVLDIAGTFEVDDIENFENLSTSSESINYFKELVAIYRGGMNRPIIKRTEEILAYDSGFTENNPSLYWLRWFDYLLNRV
jgi:phenylpropionate dioxygenase-like ring-hydroxylating dioxygenase large terminal subunit